MFTKQQLKEALPEALDYVTKYKKKKSEDVSVLGDSLFDEDDEELYDDQTLVDNTEYHSERALISLLTKRIRL